MYVFGDGACSTTNNLTSGNLYYGNRYCNGRVWIEVLAQRQGLTYDSKKNWSYYGYESGWVMTNLAKYAAPADAGSALFVVWVCDADFVDMLTDPKVSLTDIKTWTNAVNRFLTNHLTVIQQLYAKGARTLVMPNAIDATKVPEFSGLSVANKSFVRQRTMDFNAGLTNVFKQAKASCPGLTLCTPDLFSLMDNIIAQPKAYGFTNVVDDAIETLANTALNGPGTNFLFWDYVDPSAKAHMIIADQTQQLLSPAGIGSLKQLNGTNRLALTNVPVGRDGLIEGCTTLGNWATVTNFSSTNVTQSVPFPAQGARQFYRLRFPFLWTWP